MSRGLPQSETINVTTDASGDASAYSSRISGRILGIRYVKTDFADGVDFTITTETSAQNIWVDTNINASETVNPRVLAQGTDGAALTAIYDYVAAAGERIKFVVAAGGNVKTGSFILYFES